MGSAGVDSSAASETKTSGGKPGVPKQTEFQEVYLFGKREGPLGSPKTMMMAGGGAGADGTGASSAAGAMSVGYNNGANAYPQMRYSHQQQHIHPHHHPHHHPMAPHNGHTYQQPYPYPHPQHVAMATHVDVSDDGAMLRAGPRSVVQRGSVGPRPPTGSSGSQPYGTETDIPHPDTGAMGPDGVGEQDLGDEYDDGEGDEGDDEDEDDNRDEEDHDDEDEDDDEYEGSIEVRGDGGIGGEVDGEGPVKLFVGQVPKSLEERDLYPTFSEFGPLQDIAIIRDKHTGQHRGCAFVTFQSRESALSATDALHNQFTLPKGRKPLQIRPATTPSGPRLSSPELENKLFVGMLARNAGEKVIRDMFSPYGEINAIYMIRNNDGSRKSCAFVKFASRDGALAAIENLNGRVTMEGVARPLIVKFADTKSQRRARHYHAARREQLFAAAGGNLAAHPGQGGAYYVPGAHPALPYSSHPQAMAITTPAAAAAPPPYAPHSQFPGPYASQHPGTVSPPPQQAHSYMYPGYGLQPGSPFPGQTSPGGGGGGRGGTRGRHQNRSPRPPVAVAGYPPGQAAPGMVAEAANPRPREGPAGANLFIYHLPHDLTDADLATAFNPFGNVISAKVYVDRYTGESKGFGFVSYDSVISAEHAIDQMNGFQIGSKRLKVQHKRVNNRPQFAMGHTGLPPPPMPGGVARPVGVPGAAQYPLVGDPTSAYSSPGVVDVDGTDEGAGVLVHPRHQHHASSLDIASEGAVVAAQQAQGQVQTDRQQPSDPHHNPSQGEVGVEDITSTFGKMTTDSAQDGT